MVDLCFAGYCGYRLWLRGLKNRLLNKMLPPAIPALSSSLVTSSRRRSSVAGKAEKGKTVLASGVFDLLHLGHVRFLEEARKAGGAEAKLIVVVARDRTVEKAKGRKPVIPEYQRCALVASLKVVDQAVLGYESYDMGKVLERIKPDIIAVGHDSDKSGLEKTVKDYVKKKNLDIKIVKIGKFSSDELDSSSMIKQRIIEQFRR